MAATKKITTGSTHTFRLIATKDDTTWDLTGATVTLYLTDPDGVETSYTASLTDEDNGIADYTVATSVLDQVGTWQRQWRVAQSGVDLTYTPKKFGVEEGR